MIKICYNWGFTPFPWNDGSWTWSECELIQEVCAVWGSTPNPWKMANWLWKECGVLPKGPCAVWGTTGIPWKDSNWWWSACSGSIPPIPPIPVVGVGIQPPGLDANTLIAPWLIEPWEPYRAGEDKKKQDKKKRLIKVICKVKGQTYEEEKEVGNYEITVDDIKMVIDAVSNIDLDVKLEE